MMGLDNMPLFCRLQLRPSLTILNCRIYLHNPIKLHLGPKGSPHNSCLQLVCEELLKPSHSNVLSAYVDLAQILKDCA